MMKKCPFCAEEIQGEAIKCKHCGAFLEAPGRRPAEGKIPWYFRTSFIVFALCSIGPLALPLIWWHPKASRTEKVGMTIVVLVLSWILFRTTMASIRTIREYSRLLNGL